MSDLCSACGARILWARSASTGRAMPLDPMPSERGNITLAQGPRGETIARVVPRADGGPGLYVSHFATCPEAARFRRAPKAEAGGAR